MIVYGPAGIIPRTNRDLDLYVGCRFFERLIAYFEKRGKFQRVNIEKREIDFYLKRYSFDRLRRPSTKYRTILYRKNDVRCSTILNQCDVRIEFNTVIKIISFLWNIPRTGQLSTDKFTSTVFNGIHTYNSVLLRRISQSPYTRSPCIPSRVWLTFFLFHLGILIFKRRAVKTVAKGAQTNTLVAEENGERKKEIKKRERKGGESFRGKVPRGLDKCRSSRAQ